VSRKSGTSGYRLATRKGAREQFGIVRGKLKADIECLFDIGRFTRIKRLAAKADVTPVSPRAAKRGGLAHRRWSRKESSRALEHPSRQSSGNSVSRDVEEADVPASTPKSICNGVGLALSSGAILTKGMPLTCVSLGDNN
jgi:hypothetical protein